MSCASDKRPDMTDTKVCCTRDHVVFKHWYSGHSTLEYKNDFCIELKIDFKNFLDLIDFYCRITMSNMKYINIIRKY